MKRTVLKVHPGDNIIVALKDFKKKDEVVFNGKTYQLLEDIPVKHKFAALNFEKGAEIIMYGVKVGKAKQPIAKGERISTDNVVHDSEQFEIGQRKTDWLKPDVSKYKALTFNGFHRADGKVGTRNFWLVVPLVFCENRNIKVIRDAMSEQLGYITDKEFSIDVIILDPPIQTELQPRTSFTRTFAKPGGSICVQDVSTH